MSHRRLAPLLTLALVATAAAVLPILGASPADARTPRLTHHYHRKIERLAPYVAQKRCSPKPKAGTVAFANLLLRTYPRSRSLGISRACNVGGTSEHKEGRAFDWGMSASNAQDRRQVHTLLHWLLKTDRFGNRHAMARRLGIQYMIWNHRIWGAYSASSGWRSYTGSNPHTDHVHFSLSWAGARKLSSFWHPGKFPHVASPPPPGSGSGGGGGTGSGGGDGTGTHAPPPAPTPDNTHQPRPMIAEPTSPRHLDSGRALRHETVTVATRRRGGTRPQHALRAGHRYLVEASGTYRYDRQAGSVADAECSRSSYSSWWRRDRSLRTEDWRADHLDLYLDGHDLYAEADSGQDCDETSHTYRWIYTAPRGGRPPLKVWDPTSYRNNRGHLTVRILDLGRTVDKASWTVPSRAAAGVTSPTVLTAGRDYRVRVTGAWDDGAGGSADAACASSSAYPTMRRTSAALRIGQFDDSGERPQLGAPDAVATALTRGCRRDHTYSWVLHARRTQPLNVRVFDPSGYHDNDGALTVSVSRFTGDVATTSDATGSSSGSGSDGGAGSGAATGPETVVVQGDRSQATPTSQSYTAGDQLTLTVRGTYAMRGGSSWIVADAECTATASDPHWEPARLHGTFLGSTQPLGDLTVNGRLYTWEPQDGSGSCDQRHHTYTLDYTVPRTGQLALLVADDYVDDNSGALEVTVSPR